MLNSQSEYYRRREQQERDRAAKSTCLDGRRIHQVLADAYADRQRTAQDDGKVRELCL